MRLGLNGPEVNTFAQILLAGGLALARSRAVPQAFRHNHAHGP